ncbi:MAG: hypothetical protein K2P84_03110 [Undibacterium sp.]|nr:hypothetical protein [Undibacterium sp.]
MRDQAQVSGLPIFRMFATGIHLFLRTTETLGLTVITANIGVDEQRLP